MTQKRQFLFSLICVSLSLCNIGQNLSEANKDLLISVIHKDTSGIRQALSEGANINLTIGENSLLTLTPLTISVGLDDSLTYQMLIKKGAKPNAIDNELLLALYLNNSQFLEKYLSDTIKSEDYEQYFHIVLRSVQNSHWVIICDSLKFRLKANMLTDQYLNQTYFSLRSIEPDAKAEKQATSFSLLLNHASPDHGVLEELFKNNRLTHILSSKIEFSRKISALPLCDMVEHISNEYLIEPSIRQVFLDSIKVNKTKQGCVDNLFKYYLPNIIRSGNLKKFQEINNILPSDLNNNVGYSIDVGFLMDDSIRDFHLDVLEELLNKNLPLHSKDSPYGLFGYVAMNRIYTPERNLLFLKILEKAKLDTTLLTTTFGLAYDEVFMSELLKTGADPEKSFERKLRTILFRKVSPELIALMLDKCQIMEGIENIVPEVVDREYLQIIKRALLRNVIINSEIKPHIWADVDKIKVRHLIGIVNSSSFITEYKLKHYSRGVTPTNLIQDSWIKMPPQKDGFNKGSYELAIDTFSYHDSIPHRSSNLRYTYRASPFTAANDQLYIVGSMIKKGDKLYYKANSVLTIPKLQFDPGTDLFFPVAQIDINVRDTIAKLTVRQNGKSIKLKEGDLVDIDLTAGETEVFVTGMEGFQLSNIISLWLDYDFDAATKSRYSTFVSETFSEKERIKHYAALHRYSLFHPNIMTQKSRKVATNLMSTMMLGEKYPAHILEELHQAVARVSSIDQNVSAFRQFYVIHKGLSADLVPELSNLFSRINLNEIEDSNTKSRLISLRDRINQQANQQVLADAYLEVFTSKYFEELSLNIQVLQGLVMELAQFMNDSQLAAEYQKRGIDTKKLGQKITPSEISIKGSALNGRGVQLLKFIGY